MPLVFMDIRDIYSRVTYRINPGMVVRLNGYLNSRCEPVAGKVEILLPVSPGVITVDGTIEEWEEKLCKAANSPQPSVEESGGTYAVRSE